MASARLMILAGGIFGLVLGGLAGAEEWVELFDGETLSGWVQRNGMARFSVEDGGIVGRNVEGSPNSFLCTERGYGDFELEFEVRLDRGLNSGVQIRSKTKAGWFGGGEGRVYGPQVEIAVGGEAGYVYGEATGRGWLTPKARRVAHGVFRDGEWNRFRVVARGPRIRTWINGEAIEDLVDDAIYRSHPRGFIGLQVHGIPRGQGPYEVAWRKLRLRELD